jgi:hypothetical protein
MFAKQNLKYINVAYILTLTKVKLANTEIGIRHSVTVITTVPSGLYIVLSSIMLT